MPAADLQVTKMFHPPASAYNTVLATGKIRQDLEGAETILNVHVAFLPKFVMIFNLDAVDDGFWSATMGNLTHVRWDDGDFDAAGGLEALHGVVNDDEWYIREGTAVESAALADDHIIGWRASDAALLGGVGETIVYSCLGAFTRSADYSYADDGGSV